MSRTLVLTDGRVITIERQLCVDDSGQAVEKYVAVLAPETESA